jgi:O-succinylbenzoate synthase
VAATPICPSAELVREWIAKLKGGLDNSEHGTIVSLLREAVPDFRNEAR